MAEAVSTKTGDSTQFIDSVRKRLANDYFANRSFTLAPFDQPSTHPCFKIESNQQSIFCKWLLDHPFALNRPREQIVIQQQMAEQAISVSVLFAPEDYQYFLMPYLPVKSIEQLKKVNMRNKVNALAQKLIKLHQQDIDVEAIDLPAILRRYLVLIDNFPQPMIDLLTKQINEIETWLAIQRRTTPLVLCHHDLSLANVLDTADPKVIDWEYARMGMPLYDLASCIAINQFSPRMQRWLLEDYLVLLGRSDEFPYQEKLLEIYVDIAEVCNHLWYFAMKKVENPEQRIIVLAHLLGRLSQKMN